LILFNSDYHRKEFLKSLKKLLFRLPDFVDADKVVKALFEKSEISWVGLDFKAMNKFRIKSPPSHPNQEPTLLWNHRWDHDKNPELFLDLCSYLEQQSVPYKLILLGENGNAAGIKTKLIERFKDNIEFEGYVLDKQEYYALIQKATLLPVTADQDFYGLSTMEAIYLGVTPLLPTNKVYNEFYLEKLFPELYYDNIDELHQRAEKNCSHINFFNLSSDLLRKHDISLTARQLESYLKKMKHSHAI